MEKKHLLIFNQHASYITIDIANVFAELVVYDEIVLLAGVVNVREEKLNKQIRVIKTIPYKKKNIFTRFFSWSVAFLHLLFLLTFKLRSYKLFLVSNPPLISFLPWFSSRKYDTLIFDVYPDALAGSGFVKNNSPIYKIWAKANLQFYRKAIRVFTISNGMKKSISQYCTPEKIEVVPLWSSFPPVLIPREENLFIKKHQLLDKFIVMYSGNMGKGLGLEAILKVAENLLPEKDILFLFIGEGWMMADMETQANEGSLSNCLFMPYQDASILKHSLSAADISIVALPPSTSNISIPNKTYTLIALGRPLLCLTSPESDLSQLVMQNNIGACFQSQEVSEMADFILRAKQDETFRNTLNENAIKCSGNFTKANAALFV